MTGLILPSNLSTTFSKLKIKKRYFGAIMFEVIQAARGRPMGQNLGIWVKIVSLNTILSLHIHHCFYDSCQILPLIWIFLLENR